MITVSAALGDLEKIEKDLDENDKATIAIVRALKVMVKMLSTIRSNQLLTDDDKKRIVAAREKKEANK